MESQHTDRPRLRVYPLDPRTLTQEQIAVTFAMTSRNPAPFDEIARAVTEAKAKDFNERWVVGYGHASVAEHAVIHLAVENLSRLACDELEDNRLASYTEKSSRYQVLDRGSYHLPAELQGHPLEATYARTADRLFDIYHGLVPRTIEHLKSTHPRKEGERDGAYNLRLRRIATDSCRFVLPASTLTNVGVTANARTLEHALTRLLSSSLEESRALGRWMKDEATAITPTLIKYAEWNSYIADTREELRRSAEVVDATEEEAGPVRVSVSLEHYDARAEQKLVAAILYRFSGRSYQEVFEDVSLMTRDQQEKVVDIALSRLGPHDPPLRELETVDYTFELALDYGAFREYRRHRMQTYLPQPLGVRAGYVVPDLIREAGLEGAFREAMDASSEMFAAIAEEVSPLVAQYAVTHAHRVRVLTKMNLRECYHLFKLRAAPQAHFTIREAARQAKTLVEGVHPLLIRYIRLREDG